MRPSRTDCSPSSRPWPVSRRRSAALGAPSHDPLPKGGRAIPALGTTAIRTRVVDPGGHGDCNSTAKSASTTKLPPPSNPLKVVQAFVKALYTHVTGLALMLHWRGAFFAWRGTHWSECEDAAIRTEIYKFTEHAWYVNDKAESLPWAPNRHKVGDCVDALKAATHLKEGAGPSTWLESVGGVPPDRELVAVHNGLLHVNTRQLYDHDPRFFNQVSVPFDYNADAGAPTKWIAFLNELWPDDLQSIDALQEFFGYVVSGRTDLHKILLLIGPSRAGKGVVARVLGALVGRGNHVGPTLSSLGTISGCNR